MATKTKVTRPHRVVSQVGDKKGRKLFEGNEADARRFVEQNFPRTHVDDNTVNRDIPVHDVKLINPSGVEEVYHADTGWVSRPDYNADPDEEVGDEE
jgi:hypothetical protein